MDLMELDKSDLPVYLELLRELDKEESLTVEEGEQLLIKIQRYPYYKLFKMVNENGKIIGTFALIILDNFGHGGLKIAIVENVVVNPFYKRKGIGKLMMEKARDIALDEGCYKLMLSSNEKRIDAHSFYESIGFEKHGISFRTELVNV